MLTALSAPSRPAPSRAPLGPSPPARSAPRFHPRPSRRPALPQPSARTKAPDPARKARASRPGPSRGLTDPAGLPPAPALPRPVSASRLPSAAPSTPRPLMGRPGPARLPGTRPATTRPRRPLPLRRGRGPPAPSREAAEEDAHHGEGCAGLLPSPFGRTLRAAAAVNVFLRRRRRLRLLTGPSAASRSCAVRRITRARGRRCGGREPPGRFGGGREGAEIRAGREAGTAPGVAEKGAESPGAAAGPGFPRSAPRSAPPRPPALLPRGELQVCSIATRTKARCDVSPASAPLPSAFCSRPCPAVALTVNTSNARRGEIESAARYKRHLQRALVGRSAAVSPCTWGRRRLGAAVSQVLETPLIHHLSTCTSPRQEAGL